MNQEEIIEEIRKERSRQDNKWGEQNWPILDMALIHREPERMCEEYEIPSENRARALVEMLARRSDLTYMHILIEEISEAASCGADINRLREELVQVAAVTVAMIECIDRNQQK